MIADKSDRTDITNILQQADLGNKENVRSYTCTCVFAGGDHVCLSVAVWKEKKTASSLPPC